MRKEWKGGSKKCPSVKKEVVGNLVRNILVRLMKTECSE